jgi:hypothetical protein
MDLPTCPSCGQSVLDDDAVDCPFCGASMSAKPGAKPTGAAAAKQNQTAGKKPSSKSSGDAAKKSPAQSRPRRRANETVADEDDPFEVSAGPVAANVIAARPKPSRGRLHRVICPMCDRPGFVPKSAVGKQIRCANPDCLVPVFTAPDPNAVEDARNQNASSDSAATAGKEIAPTAGSPLKVYAIAAVVLLPLAAGLVYFLNRPGSDNGDLSKPADIDWNALANAEEGNPEETAEATAEPAAATTSPAAIAEQLVKRMIGTARLEGNRDKAFARRLTADAWFRLGNPAEAAQELGQLATIARQTSSGRTWLQVEPRLTQYWKLAAAGDTAGATKEFQQIASSASQLESGGRLAFETLIGAAAAMVNQGDAGGAEQLIAKHDRDRSILTNRDVMNSAAWFQSVSRMRSAGLRPFYVGDVFAWDDPIRTCVALDLATHKRWDAAVAWSASQKQIPCVADSLTAVAQIASALEAGDATLQSIRQAAEAAGPQIALRVDALIAAETNDAELFATCRDRLAAQPLAEPAQLPSLSQLIRSSIPDFDRGPRLNAAAAAEVARAAVILNDQATAELGVRQLYLQLASIVPGTPDLRRMILELEQNESQVEKRIASELRISSSREVKAQFRRYRRALDQYASAAERRRLYLMQRLSRIVRAGGVEAVVAVMDDEKIALKQEIVMDELSRLLAASAARQSRKIEAIEQPDKSLIVKRPSRMEALPEAALSTTLVNAWSAADAGRLSAAVRSLGDGQNMPGFREALLNEIIEQASEEADDPAGIYSAIAVLRNPVWREETLQVASRILARRGLTKASQAWLDSERVPPTELVTAYYGLVLGLLEQEQ